MDNLKQIVPHGTVEAFHKYLDILKVWNEKINLTSRASNLELVFLETVREAVQISSELQNKKIVDIGSGGGFPGLFLGVLGHDITLVEINYKKTVFLQHVISELGLKNVKVENKDIKKFEGNCDVITSKAVSSVLEIVEMSSHLIDDKMSFYLPKSEDQLIELEELHSKWSFELRKMQIAGTNREVILILTNLVSK